MPYYRVFPQADAYYSKLVPLPHGRKAYDFIRECADMEPDTGISEHEWDSEGSELMEHMSDDMEDGEYVKIVVRVSHCRGVTVKAEDEEYALETNMDYPSYPKQTTDGWTLTGYDFEMSGDVELSDEDAYKACRKPESEKSVHP